MDGGKIQKLHCANNNNRKRVVKSIELFPRQGVTPREVSTTPLALSISTCPLYLADLCTIFTQGNTYAGGRGYRIIEKVPEAMGIPR